MSRTRFRVNPHSIVPDHDQLDQVIYGENLTPFSTDDIGGKDSGSGPFFNCENNICLALLPLT